MGAVLCHLERFEHLLVANVTVLRVLVRRLPLQVGISHAALWSA